jgi:hypothetical protein
VDERHTCVTGGQKGTGGAWYLAHNYVAAIGHGQKAYPRTGAGRPGRMGFFSISESFSPVNAQAYERAEHDIRGKSKSGVPTSGPNAQAL